MDDENNEQSLKKTRRPGWTFRIPGILLKSDAKRWTDAQRAAGIGVRCVMPNAEEEKRSLVEALSEGSGGGGVGVAQIKGSLSEIDGVTIPYIERDLMWEDLGRAGREVVVEMFQRATTADKEALAAARASFSLSV